MADRDIPREAGEGARPTEGQPELPRLRRSTDDKVVAGVCGGLGVYFGVDPVWFRLAFVVLTVGGGSGVLLYIVAWIVIPAQEPGRALERGPSSVSEHGPVIAGIALVALGLMLLIDAFVPWFDRLMWPMVVLAAGLALIYTGIRRGRE